MTDRKDFLSWKPRGDFPATVAGDPQGAMADHATGALPGRLRQAGGYARAQRLSTH